jgi:hypothetical protein
MRCKAVKAICVKTFYIFLIHISEKDTSPSTADLILHNKRAKKHTTPDFYEIAEFQNDSSF